jgi:hypothetical protein
MCGRDAHRAEKSPHGCGHVKIADMSATFSYRPTGAGWARSSLDIDGESVTVRLSNMTPHAPEDFLDALLALFYGARISWVSWWNEPDIYRWRFTHVGDRLVQVAVIDTDSDDPWWEDECSVRIRFATEITLAELANAVVVGFENLLKGSSEEAYRRDWLEGLAGLRERVEELTAILRDGPKPNVPERLYRNYDSARSNYWASDLFRRRPAHPRDAGEI